MNEALVVARIFPDGYRQPCLRFADELSSLLDIWHWLFFVHVTLKLPHENSPLPTPYLSFFPPLLTVARSASRPARMTMLFGGGKKATPAYKVGEGSANKGSYVPEGLTKAQYEKALAAEQLKKAAKAKKFPKGKEPQTLTEWMEEEKKKGNEGKGLLYKGHRMVKTKYPEWYTDISPV